MNSIDLERIKDATDIVQLVGRRVALKKNGSNYTGLCPFHDEKTPSFTVSAQKQFYHCFGCGAHGDALQWLVEAEGMDFMDAVRKLAGDAGITLPECSANQQKIRDAQEPLYAANAAACEHFSKALHDPTGNPALNYLMKNRGVSSQSIQHFALGWASNQFPELADADTLAQAGLTRQKDGRTYPFFYQRVTFPFRNRRGQVIGFGGRGMRDAQPKYLNTNETAVFNKSRTLYGLFEAQACIRKNNHAIVVEGYLDTILMHQHGYTNTVATCGTAVTDEQIQLLLAMAERLTFIFDGDKAGHSAAIRAVHRSAAFVKDSQTVDFVFLPTGEDPDSFIQKDGAPGMQHLLETAKPLSTLIMRLFRVQGTDSLESKAKQAQAAQRFLAEHLGHAPKLKALLAQEMAHVLGVPIELQQAPKRKQVATPPVKKPAAIKPQAHAEIRESPLVLNRVIHPVLRILLAFPESRAWLPGSLQQHPWIQASLALIEAGPDPDTGQWSPRIGPVAQSLNAMHDSALQRREMTSQGNVQTDAVRVFEAAAQTLAKLRPAATVSA